MDFDFPCIYEAAPQEKPRLPTIRVRLQKLVAPQRIDCQDDKETKGLFKTHAIEKLKKRSQYQVGDSFQSLLKKSAANAHSKLKFDKGNKQQAGLPSNDQSYESTTDNSMDETAREPALKYIGSPNLNLDWLSYEDISSQQVAACKLQSLSLNGGFLNSQQ